MRPRVDSLAKDAGTRKSNEAKTASAQPDTTSVPDPEPKPKPAAADKKPKPPAKEADHPRGARADRVRLAEDADGNAVLTGRGTVRDQRDIRDGDEFHRGGRSDRFVGIGEEGRRLAVYAVVST